MYLQIFFEDEHWVWTVGTCSWPRINFWMSSNSVFSFRIFSLYRDTSRQAEKLVVELRSASPSQQKKEESVHQNGPETLIITYFLDLRSYILG